MNTKLVNKSDLDSLQDIGFNSFGRIEGPRRSRGKYDSLKKRKIVNNGEKELRILLNEVDQFLKDHSDFKLGIIKGKILINDGKILKFINKNDLSKGFNLGKIK